MSAYRRCDLCKLEISGVKNYILQWVEYAANNNITPYKIFKEYDLCIKCMTTFDQDMVIKIAAMIKGKK